MVYWRFMKGLFESGVTAEMIKSKEREIRNMLEPLNATTSSQTDVSTSANQSQLPEVDNLTSPLPTISTKPIWNRTRFAWVRPLMDFWVGPLMFGAAEAGNTKRLISTLEYVGNINLLDDTGSTALHKAACGGYNDIVQLLLMKGASIQAMNHLNDTSLHLAARNGHHSTVELLLAKGASVEAVNNDNNTPLHLAARYGNAITVELLLSKGASVEAVNKDNDTPLHLARLGGHISLARLLERVQAISLKTYEAVSGEAEVQS